MSAPSPKPPTRDDPFFWTLSGFSKASTMGDVTQLSQLRSLRRALTNRQHLVRWEYIKLLVCAFALIVGLLVHAALRSIRGSDDNDGDCNKGSSNAQPCPKSPASCGTYVVSLLTSSLQVQ